MHIIIGKGGKTGSHRKALKSAASHAVKVKHDQRLKAIIEENPEVGTRLKQLREKNFIRKKLHSAETKLRDDLAPLFTFDGGENIQGPRLDHPTKDYILRLRPTGWGTEHWANLAKSIRTKKSDIKSVLFQRKMRSHVGFLTTPTADTPGTALVLHFDNQRYIIGNMSEGTQRACVQRKVGLGKVENIFMTGKTDWATTGGLLGMILTLADSSASSRAEMAKRIEEKNARQQTKAPAAKELENKQVLNIHGTTNLTHMLGTARRFVFRKGVPLYANEYRERGARENDEPDYNDTNIKVWGMAISPENGDRSRKRSHEEMEEDTEAAKAAAELAIKQEDQKDQIRRSVVASMFNSDWKLDALHESKLSEVKMPATLFIRQNGKVVKYTGPKPGEDGFKDIQVLARKPWPGATIESLPSTKPSKTAVSYIIKNHTQRGRFDPQAAARLHVLPGPNFSLLTRGQNVKALDGSIVTPAMVLGPSKPGNGFAVIELPTAEYIAPTLQRSEWGSENIINNVTAVIWILGPGVGNDERLIKFMKENPQFNHIVSSPDHCANSLALESPASAAIRLHLVDPDRFPIPQHNNVPHLPQLTDAPYTVARPGLRLQLEPTAVMEESSIVTYLDTAKVIKEMPADVLTLAKQAHAELNTPAYEEALEKRQKDLPGKDVEVIFLGTGSALPSKYRNVSATLVKVPGVGNYLLDCGENTLGQIKRVFGPETPDILRDLKAIWISHLHADHHLGTASVIRAWYAEISASEATKDNKLVVASDYGMLNWLKEYSEVEDYGYSNVKPVAPRGTYTFSEAEAANCGIANIKTCAVSHCHGALAVVLSFTNDFKVAYSGDCRPSDDFARIGYGTTLLIHEATFDDELIGDAIAKKHSTTSEALEVGRAMGARRILLTHFSQRYQKIPVLDMEGDVRSAVAFDYMRVKVGDIARVEAFRPALLKLYEEEEKAEKAESESESERREDGKELAKPDSKRTQKKVKKQAREEKQRVEQEHYLSDLTPEEGIAQIVNLFEDDDESARVRKPKRR